MLQQTRVEIATPYFERWMARFPDLASLAAASIDEVLGLWQGLGYYGRARNLHKAARLVVNTQECVIPRDFRSLRKLHGIGEYTAGAIASIAFGESVPAVDGNVRRVLARLDALEGDPARGETAKAIQKRASALVSDSNSSSNSDPTFFPGDLNQALMELGATVCKPRNPTCAHCPLREHCLAYATGRQAELPSPSPRAAQRKARWLAFALMDDERRWLVARRPEKGLLGGLWEFPMVPELQGRNPDASLEQSFGLVSVHELRAAKPVLHIFTHIRLTALPFVGQVGGKGGRDTRINANRDVVYSEYRWAKPETIGSEELPSSTLMNKLVASIQDLA